MSGAQGIILAEGFVSLRRVFNSLPDATFVLDQLGRVLDLNAAAERALGRTRHQLLGSTLRELGDWPALACRFDEAMRQVVREGKAHESVVTLDTPRGARHWEVRLYPDMSDSEAAASVLVIAREVTQAKRLEGELIGRSNELSQLGDSLCHDLRSPLATIRSFLGFLAADLKARDESQIASDLGSIHNAVDRMTDLITAIVKRTRLSGTNASRVETTLGDVIGDALTLLAGCVAVRGARVDVTPEPWIIRGERGTLIQIFENLIENSVKFAKHGERPRIAISVEEWGGSPTISVCDQGIGIEPGQVHRVFDRFERLGAEREGTGVGLSIVKRLVERHGGKVWVESPGVGCGTTVRLTLTQMYKQAGAAQ
jgi:PAS domain S-box-containing protein